jgi:hypothetical protein
MADPGISDEQLIAWIDGELSPDAAAEVVEAIERDPALAARAAAHRRLARRMTAAFGPIAEQPVALPEREAAPVISLAAARAARAEREANKPHRWVVPGAIAASLVVGVLVGEQATMVASVDDRAGALALAKPVAQALDSQLSGEPGPIRVSLSFRNKDGGYCRSFAGQHIDGIACRSGGVWQLRYAAPATRGPNGGYRMAGSDTAEAAVVDRLIAGNPLDSTGESDARTRGWQ